MVSLADLSGKLGQFIGQSDEVTTAINDGIDAIIDSDKDFKSLRKSPASASQPPAAVSAGLINDGELSSKIRHYEKEIASLSAEIEQLKKQKTSVPDDLNKSHESHQSKLESLQKLKSLNESLNSVNNQHDDVCKILLNNLCTGLEKFLGYHDGNYTGEGIVYSDLDRLCDGVMSFLHGVLSEVKNDESVTKYDNNLHEPKLDKLLKELYDSIGQGSGVFGPQVTAVSGWLGRYESEVNKKIRLVGDRIKNLKTQVEEHKSKIQEEKDEDVSDQIEYWTQRAGWYVGFVNNAEIALNDIDGNLKDKLSPHINMLEQATKTFQAAAKNKDLHSMYDTAGIKWNAVITYVVERFQKRGTGLQRYLKYTIGELRDKLNKLKSAQFAELVKSVNDELDSAYRLVKDGIKSLIDKYDEQVVKVLGPVVLTAKDLTENFPKTQSAITLAIGKVDTEMDYFKKLKNVAQIKELIGTVPLLTGIGKSGDPFNAVKEHFRNLDSKVMQPLRTVIARIGASLGRGATAPRTSELNTALSPVKSQLEEVQKVVLGQLNELNGLQEKLQKILGTEFTVSSIDASSYKDVVDAVVNKLNKNTDSITRNEVISLLNTLAAIAESVSYHSKTVVEEVMQGVEKQIKKEVETVAGAIEGKLGKIIRAINNGSDVDVDYHTDPGTKAVSLERLVNKFKTQINQALQGLHTHVGQKSDDIENDKLSIYAALNDLKKNVDALGHKVTDVKEKVGDLWNGLDGCINYANDMLIKTPTMIASVMEALRKEVNQNITDAFTDLQSKAKSLYTARKTQEVEALQKIVGKQLQKITEAINKDRMQGSKKFLDALKKQFVDRLKDYFPSSGQGPAPQKSFTEVAKNLHHYFNHWMLDVYEQEDFKKMDYKIEPSRKALHTLLTGLHGSGQFDHAFSKHLDALDNAVTKLRPKTFTGWYSILLDAMKNGLTALAGELENAYVSSYSQQTIEWTNSWKEKKLTDNAKRCGKVFLTCVSTLFADFDCLRKHCDKGKKWNTTQINTHNGNPLGDFFSKCGYKVSAEKDSHEGHLKNKTDCKGQKIHELLEKDDHYLVKRYDEYPEVDDNNKSILKKLYDYLNHYNEVCHHSTFSARKHPCSVYEMSVWLTGLPHNRAYDKLNDHVKSLFQVDDKKDPSKKITQSIDAHPSEFSVLNIYDAIRHITSNSRNLLTTILGHGDEFTLYASDFSNNTLTLQYPSDPSQCLEMLVNVLRRLHPVLTFLHGQCRLAAQHYGWASCQYGKNIPTTKWPCNVHSADKSKCQPKCEPNCQANDQPNCQATSPLQCYLTDSLVGHLPHDVTSVGCKSSCSTCPKSTPGMPCITPMGFRGFSSSTRTGKELGDVLSNFLSNDHVTCLFTLLPKPPSTLPEHMGFVFSLITSLTPSNTRTRRIKNRFQVEFENSITNASIEQYSDPSTLTDALTAAYGSSSVDHSECVNSHLTSLTTTDTCKGKNNRMECAPYLSSIYSVKTGDAADVLLATNADVDSTATWMVPANALPSSIVEV
ncbi:Apolipophorin-III superfamily protein, putative [Babesia ovata]|uniref:Apolipophorin-III superfamily protein, putative n=1 Tax=Babesia ovata TaxID=189622 RepID=A0A2H6KK88_9APIC|nr:Apolipophorin-III superfamily protein, putative [Babesia ovata]GBE63402.1 Apolipophorin-III superfamily protein, putative [Babesia ovata]